MASEAVRKIWPSLSKFEQRRVFRTWNEQLLEASEEREGGNDADYLTPETVSAAPWLISTEDLKRAWLGAMGGGERGGVLRCKYPLIRILEPVLDFPADNTTFHRTLAAYVSISE